MSDVKAVKRKLTSFVPDAKNANKHTVRGLAMLEDSLRKYGAGRSILVDRNGKVIAGNAAIESAVDIGLTDAIVVPTDGKQLVVVQRVDIDLESKTGRELALADNRVAQVDLEFDPEVLSQLANEGVDLTQFWDDDELAALLADVAGDEPPGDPGAQVDKAEELQAKWQVQRGDLWAIGNHRLLCGDSTDAANVKRVMAGETIDAVVTDPPYGIGWDTDYTRFSYEYQTAKRVHYAPVQNDDKPFDPRPYLEYSKVILFGANWYCQHIPIGSWLVWDKRHPSGEAWLSDAELAWVKGGKGVYIYAETVQGAHRKEEANHPTQKPVGLMVWAMDKAKIEAGTSVLDPYCGSGTTLVACEQTGRKGRGIEIEPKYVAVTLERLAAMGLQPQRERA